MKALAGNLRREMEEEAAEIVAALARATKGAGERAKNAYRAKVQAAMPGRSGRHVKAIRNRFYEVGRDGQKTPASLVYSTLGRGSGSNYVDYIAPHVTGATLGPRAGGGDDKGRFLVLPVKGVSRRVSRDKRALEGLGTDPRLALIPLPGGRFLFVRKPPAKKDGGFRAGARTTILAILVPKVRVKADINLPALEAESATDLVQSIIKELGVRGER